MSTQQPDPRTEPAEPAGPTTPDALVPGPLLAVYAHPDDETLQAGALLALAAVRGRRVVVVTATRGERGEMIGMPEVEGTAEVREIRAREIRDALAALGVHEHHFLDELVDRADDDGAGPTARAGWTDSGMAWVSPGVAGPALDAPPSALTLGDLDAQARALAGLVRTLQPSLVICDEPGGGYGHPDHVRTHQITMAAVDLAAQPTAGGGPAWTVPAVGWIAQEDARLLAALPEIARGVVEEGAATHDGEPHALSSAGSLPSLARSREEIDVELDATSVLPRVLGAMRCYGSQVQAATIPALDHALVPSRALGGLRPNQAAVGWFAVSNGVAQPILPVVALQLARGDAASAELTTLPSVASGEVAAGGESTADAGAAAAPVGTARAAGGTGRPSGTRSPWVRFVTGAGLGLVAAVAGTLVHRARFEVVPYGMVLAFAIVAVATLLARSIGRGTAIIGSALGVLLTIQALTYLGRGGDVLVAQDTLGLAWLAVSLAGVVVAAFLPARWVGEEDRRGSRASHDEARETRDGA